MTEPTFKTDLERELYEALELAERALSNSPATYEHEIPVIRAALARARGEEVKS